MRVVLVVLVVLVVVVARLVLVEAGLVVVVVPVPVVVVTVVGISFVRLWDVTPVTAIEGPMTYKLLQVTLAPSSR